jgi:acetoin utilization protein AcuB
MIVSMWMSAAPVTIGSQASIVEAANLMTAKHVRRLPVVTAHPEGPRLIGIISASDLRRAFPAHINPFGLKPETFRTDTTAADIMNPQPITTLPDAPIEEAARVMSEQKVGALPVVRDETLVGLITESDIFRAFVSIFESSSGGVRVTFDVSKNEDTLDLMSKLARLRHVRVHSLIATKQHDHPVCVVRLTGTAVDAVVEDLWKSGHQVLNVLRLT